jgi:hypothetical protein
MMSVQRALSWARLMEEAHRALTTLAGIALKACGVSDYAGAMPTSLIIADDFIEHPHELRKAALQLTYPDQDGVFPGRNSLQRINIEGLAAQVSNIVGEPLTPISPLESHAKCRVTLAADKGKAKVHVDRAYWSGILYLSRPEDCRGGTEFFRHKRTGTDRRPLNNEELAAMGFSSIEEVHREIIEKESNDDSKWELTMQVPMRFNRLVLLRPWLWHTAGPAFGESLEDGRLVYLMFFASAAS